MKWFQDSNGKLKFRSFDDGTGVSEYSTGPTVLPTGLIDAPANSQTHNWIKTEIVSSILKPNAHKAIFYNVIIESEMIINILKIGNPDYNCEATRVWSYEIAYDEVRLPRNQNLQ